jgi:LPS export ABC transporter protein LptC
MPSANITGKVNQYFRWTILLAGFFAVGSCENDEKKLPDYRNKRTALEEGHKIETYWSQGGKTKAKLTAPLMYRYQADTSYTEFPNTLHVDFFTDSLQNESKLDAHYGKYREWENKVYLRDSVVAINLLTRDTLKTNELWWDQNTQKVYTHQPVHIHKKDGTIIDGQDGMEAPQNFSSYVIYKGSGRGIVPKAEEDSIGGRKDSVQAAPPPLKAGGIPSIKKDSLHRE